MVKTAEQKVRDRYRAELSAGKTPRAITETNRVILEEIRATIEVGKAQVREVAEAGATRIRSAKQEAVSAIDAAKRQALREIASASSSGSGVTPAAQETPLIQAVAQEALGFNEPGQTTEPEQKAETHAENYPVALPGLPQAFSPPVPEVLSSSRARRPLKRPLPEPAVGAVLPFGEDDAKEKRAHAAWVERMRQSAADRAELAERAARREQDTQARRAWALQEIDSECRGCARCADMDYAIHGPAADLMCSKHTRRYNELVQEADSQRA